MSKVTMFVNGKQVWESAGEGVLVRNVSLMTPAGEAGSASPASGNIEILVEEMVAGDSNQHLTVVDSKRLEDNRKDEKEFAQQVSDREAPITSTQRKLLEKGEDTETQNTESVENEGREEGTTAPGEQSEDSTEDSSIKSPTETSPEPSTSTPDNEESSKDGLLGTSLGTSVSTGGDDKDSQSSFNL